MEEEAAEIRVKEREMASIKARISSMSDAKRQASSAEEQLREVVQEVTRLRERLAHVEVELRSAAQRKHETEKDISNLETGIAASKETLHLRQLSVAELRSNRNETERQLAQTLREREERRESANKAQQGFDSEAKSASAELDRWKSEADELASAIDALDVQKKELQQKAASEEGGQNDFLINLQKELDEAVSAYAAFEDQKQNDDANLAAAEAHQRDAEKRLHEAEQAANALRSELQEEGEGARTATEAVKRELALQVSKVAQLEGSLGENRNQLKTIQRHVDSLAQDLLDKTVKSAEDEELLAALTKQLQQEEQALTRLRSEKETMEVAATEELTKGEEWRRKKQALEDDEVQGELAQRSDLLSNTRTMAVTELTSAAAEIAQLQQAQKKLDEEVAQVDVAASDVERSRQETKQKIERMQAALEAASQKKSMREKALEARSRHLASLEKELSAAKQEMQSASAAALKLRASASRTAAESEIKEEALLERFVQLKSELEEHQEVSKQQEEERKAVLEKLTEAHKQTPHKQVQAKQAKAKKDELQLVVADLRSSLQAATASAKAEALKTQQAQEQLDQQRQELEVLLADAAQQEVLAEALKTSISEQKAEHQKFLEAQKGRTSASKDQEMKVAERASELRVRRAELAIKQEAVAAACSVEKERLAELRRDFEEVRAASMQKIEAAKQDLQKDAFAKDLEALKSHEAEAASLRMRIEDLKAQEADVLKKAEARKTSLSDFGDKPVEDSERRKTQLLKELLSQRAASLQEATKECREAEINSKALQQEQRQQQEEYRSVVEKMKSQVSQGNELYVKLQAVEQDIRTLEDESDLLTLGLHEAETQKASLEKESGLVQQQAAGQFAGALQTWAQEVQRLRVAAKVQSHEDELQHWKQAASENPAAVSQLEVQAAEKLLQQKAFSLEEQLSSKEKELRELEGQAQPEEVPGSIRSVPSSLHGSLTMGASLSVKAAASRRALVIGCNYCGTFAPLRGCANDAWNVQCLLRQSLQYTEAQVRCLVDYAKSSSTPANRCPTRDNIIAELQWLTGNAKPGDNVLLYFSGYGAQQPDGEADGLYQGSLVPADFADDLPEDVEGEVERCCKTGSELSPEMAQRAASLGGYRLVPMSLITAALHTLPSGCKATVILDCCQSAVLPLLRPSDHVAGVAPGPGPPRFKKLRPPTEAVPPKSEASRRRLLGLPPLPFGQSSPRHMVGSPASSSIKEETSHSSPAGSPQGIIKVPPGTSMEATQRPAATRGGPSCRCYCFAACQNDQVCCELPIEGLVQGVATWAFVKAMAACHMNTPLAQHSKAMDGILQNLRRKYRWIQQTPVIQLSASANVQDPLILP